MNKSAILVLCAAASAADLLFSGALASAQATRKSCTAEWNAAKANQTVGDQKRADFIKECLAGTAAAPAAAPAAPGEAPPAVPPLAATPKATKSTKSTKTATPAEASAPASDAVFPTAVAPKYSSETGGRARMHTCRDQYNENKATSANGGLNWIQKGGGYYSECNKHLKEG
jgi:hypothetical protein